ncbi:TetR/AcrR family transcriptional regulator [Pontibacterium sp. N1Y112]|uniref:TetR/AcrR family transcriptional regulator n=1 Tax=Pontibacterium sinense TaxID=2781979 RepID=A0A8J7FG02_9GAMM|nr:TetR/AcrR family transcriptional regulator [Pontibacterium sinense]MBE9398884.1 TetR/AcrR family transcriptional regulator [Pontibacterium sinense]
MSPKFIDDATREAREAEILQTALDVIARDGVSGLTIDKVVSKVPYSKGTVYNHVSCKEDLLTALCNNCVRRLADIFFRAASFDGNSREKMLAIGIGYMLHSQFDPTEFMLVISAKTPSVTEKSSQKRQEEHQELETKLLGTILQIISEGLANGELTLAPHLSPAQVAFSLWAMSFGTIALLQDNVERCGVRQEMTLERELTNHANLVLDGLNWTPYTPDHDWHESVQRMKATVFAPEVEALRTRRNLNLQG